MKFSAKVFFATISIFIISFTIGGYILINTLFYNALDREITAALNENKILRYSFESAIFGLLDSQHGIELATEMLSTISGRDTIVRLWSQDFNILYQSQSMNLGPQVFTGIAPGIRAYVIQEAEKGIFIQTACQMVINDETFYLESIRDINSIFAERDSGFSTLQHILIILIIFNGFIVYLILRVLTSPIRRLSRVTRMIAKGNMNFRARIESSDEIGMLASDFNSMANEIALRMQQLEETNRRQEDFVASFAHELKTPLTSMIGYADMLRSKKLMPEDQFLAAGYIFSEGKRLEALSLNLLDLIVLQKKSFPMKQVNIKTLFSEVYVIFQPVLEQQIELAVSAENGFLYIEPNLFKTLLLNLLDNARKAIEGKGCIQLIGYKEKNGYAIYVKDNGKGIPPDDLPKITEAFYRVEKSRSREKAGSGLGLAICTEIVKLHKGTLQFNSKLGEGTVVKVFIEERTNALDMGE